jgi:REP element-mobilizing transposase RayT
MPLPRKSLISINDTPFYHCVSRCVRRAYLCGYDRVTSTNYEHRRGWLEHKLLETADIFAINLCSYAIMSNHYHVVLHIRPEIAEAWSDRQVIERWHKLFNGHLFSQRFIAGEPLSGAQWLKLKSDIALWRNRLCDVSWFMRVVNECIARQANAEDRCTGRFWEGRFKSQALLDERALLSCMAYVDLNPIRAKIADTPESSIHTSVHHRIQALKAHRKPHRALELFDGVTDQSDGIPFGLKDYLTLVDWSGRVIREGKRGSINSKAPPILERLSLTPESWAILTTEFESRFQTWVGSEHIVRKVCEHKYTKPPTIRHCRALFT